MSEHPLGKAIALSYLESNLGQAIKPEELKMILGRGVWGKANENINITKLI